MALNEGPALALVQDSGVTGTETRPLAAVDRETAFRTLLDAHLERSYRLAAVILGDRHEAEDVTHDAIERAWRAFASLRTPERFEAWFHRILVNACRDRMRRRRPAVSLADGATEGPPHGGRLTVGGLDLPTRAAERDALERALGTLDPDQRIVVAMRYFLDLELEEIAGRLGAPVGTVKSRLHRAVRYLRAEYDAVARSSTEGPR